MKILVISFSIGNALGDGLRVISKDLVRTNHVSILTNSGITPQSVGTEDLCCVTFDKRHFLDFINPINYYKILRYIRSVDYDVAFVYSAHPVNCFVYCLLDRSKTVVFLHDHICHSGVGLLDYFSNLINQKWTYKNAAKIIVSCNYIKSEIVKKRFVDNSARVEIVYLGILNNLIFKPVVVCEDVDVLFFGRIEYYKGLDILLRVAEDMPNFKFVIAGKGNLSKVTGINKLPDNCEHINQYIPDEKLAELIQRCKVVVLPYRDATGTQTVQSIFYYSKPIVATSVGCFPEYITDGCDGIIVAPENDIELKNALVKMLNDEDLRLSMGASGKKKLSTVFSNKIIIERYEDIFRSVMEKSSKFI